MQLYRFDVTRLEEKMSVSSCASRHKETLSSFLVGFAFAIILNQNFVSFASFLQTAILWRKSFLDSAPSASS
jgi:hypothetical protein